MNKLKPDMQHKGYAYDEVGLMHVLVQPGNRLIYYHINRTKEITHMTILTEGEGIVFDKPTITS